ncbi:AMP-binding protein [Desertimonas flava]|uniref:AMP-binding protein n=1 Tax=Desertimonas flava TaxID=2064846 RepID=UPI0013C497E8|nr:AMP-binding protein [Desertimonas flava]
MALHPNWADLYEAIAALDPSAEAIVHGDRRITWGEFDETTARLAAVFRSWRLEPGARVALYLFNVPEYIELAVGAFKARVVPINVNYRYRGDEVRHVLSDSAAEVLVFDTELAGVIAELASTGGLPARLVAVGDGDLPGVLGHAERYAGLVAGTEPAEPIERSGDDHLILYTGGTTGYPKGVVWRHGDLFQTLSFPAYAAAGLPTPETAEGVAEAAAALRGSGASPVMLSAPPLIHGTALFLAMAALLRGGSVVLLTSRRFDARELWQLVESEGVTDIAIVGDSFARPMVAELDERDAAGDPVDLSSVRMISSAGITWGAETKAALRRRGQMVLLDMLGASEGGPFATSVTLPGQEPAATAQFTIAERAVLLDDDGSIIPPGDGRIGVLAYRGSGPIGYFNDPAKTASVFREIDGERYVIPGDYATVASDGTVTFVGRGSVCINTGGEKVYPEEVEETLKTHPAVVDCNVVGVPDSTFGDAVTAVVQLDPDAAVTDSDLVAHVHDRLAGYKAPRHIVRVDVLQRSPTGKSDYRAARAAALAALGIDA